jgi:general secretion pathway protein E
MIAELSSRLRMPALSLQQIRLQQPAFDLVPYAEAARRACVALRAADGAISVALGDPFDLDTQDWLEERLAAPFSYRLAAREDVEAYLAQQEAGFKAMDSVTIDCSLSSVDARTRRFHSKPRRKPTARWCAW